MCESLSNKCIELLRTIWEHPKTRQLFTLFFWTHFSVFVCLLFSATIGKKFGIRKRYIWILDKMFLFAASKLEDRKEQRIEEPTEDRVEESEYEQEEEVIISPECPVVKRAPGASGHFSLEDSIPYVTVGIRAIVEDCINKSFSPEELRTWNMLSRTKKSQTGSKSVTSLWLGGFAFRYGFLVPVRVVILLMSLSTLVVCTFLVGRLSEGGFKRGLNALVLCWCLDFVANALSVVARFHDKHHRPRHGIAVANHTSPIDSMLLATDNCYDMVGQRTGGFLGIFMNALAKSSTHIWFERSSQRQRKDAFKRLLSHAQNEALPPVLIFPEGICVNNTAVLLFRKGVFEMDTDIHPIAIKFDPRYGDAFWHQDSFFRYCLSMMTSWAIVCDIWYLPPMRREPQESPIQFASRVKSAIAQKGGLKELSWHGAIKLAKDNTPTKDEKEETWRKRQQSEFAKGLRQMENSDRLT